MVCGRAFAVVSVCGGGGGGGGGGGRQRGRSGVEEDLEKLKTNSPAYPTAASIRQMLPRNSCLRWLGAMGPTLGYLLLLTDPLSNTVTLVGSSKPVIP